MNSSMELEFLDLEDVSSAEKRRINTILYGSAETSAASVELPWDSGIEWETVECSTEDEGFVNDPQDFSNHSHLPPASVAAYHGTPLLSGGPDPCAAQIVFATPSCGVASIPGIHGGIPVVPVADQVQPALLSSLTDPKMFSMHHDVKPLCSPYPEQSDGVDHRSSRRPKKKRSPHEYFDKRINTEMYDEHAMMHSHPPHVTTCPLTAVTFSNSVPQTIAQQSQMTFGLGMPSHMQASVAAMPPHAYTVPQFYPTTQMMYSNNAYQLVAAAPGMFYYPPSYGSPPGGLPTPLMMAGEQSVPSPTGPMTGITLESEIPSEVTEEPVHLEQPYVGERVQSQVPDETSYNSQDRTSAYGVAEPVVNLEHVSSDEIPADFGASYSNDVCVSGGAPIENGPYNTSDVLDDVQNLSIEPEPTSNHIAADSAVQPSLPVTIKKEPVETIAGAGDAKVAESVIVQESAPPAKAWASLFKTAAPAAVSVVDVRTQLEAGHDSCSASAEDNTIPEESCASNFVEKDSVPVGLGELLSTIQLDHHSVHFMPRGLVNRGNWCYINATLQALVACPPFFNLMRSLPVAPPGLKKGHSSIPVIDAMVEFMHEFSPMTDSQKSPKNTGTKNAGKQKEEVLGGTVFEPVIVYNMLRATKSDSFKGRQEDAEEFLSCVLNGLHEEMLELVSTTTIKDHKMKNGDVASNGDLNHISDDNSLDGSSDWQVIGHKNKSCVMRSVHCNPSPILNIFGGQMCSVLQQQGSTKSATVQPFFTLQLDIQADNVQDIKSALEGLVMKEALQGFTCGNTKQEVEASRKMMLEKLPNILVLHLKRFVYDRNGGCRKLMKKIDFSFEIELSKDLLSSSARHLPPYFRKYKLFAVVYHDSQEAAKGHYITDVYHSGYDCWLRADDANIKRIPEQAVLKHNPPRVPYLLYYRRWDTIAE